MHRRLLANTVALVALATPAAVFANPEAPVPVPSPKPVTAAEARPTAKPRSDVSASDESRLRWRRTGLTWENAITTETVGIGQSYQSANPMYETTLSLEPRYYLYDGDRDVVFLDGRLDLSAELTNSDVTTKKHEATFSDAVLFSEYAHGFRMDRGTASLVSVAAPVLTLPTSTFSRENGTILGLGGYLRYVLSLPLAGDHASFFRRLILRAHAGYNHTFTTAVVPTNPELRRVRLDPEGRTVPGDQLTGTAFPEHELELALRAYLDVMDRLFLWSEFSYRPTWKYGFGSACVTTLTGCAVPDQVNDPSTYVVVTGFQAEADFTLLPELGLALGYTNVELQPGPDGRRRSIFYSPGAQFYVDFTAYLDVLYLTATGRRPDLDGGSRLGL